MFPFIVKELNYEEFDKLPLNIEDIESLRRTCQKMIDTLELGNIYIDVKTTQYQNITAGNKKFVYLCAPLYFFNISFNGLDIELDVYYGSLLNLISGVVDAVLLVKFDKLKRGKKSKSGEKGYYYLNLEKFFKMSEAIFISNINSNNEEIIKIIKEDIVKLLNMGPTDQELSLISIPHSTKLK